MEMTGDEEVELTEANAEALMGVVEQYARWGMRCIAFGYRDLPPNMDFEATSDTIKNSDGTETNLAETEMVFCVLMGIEDPLRPEVPEAIQKCYQAGIEVRLVTGDSPNTAVSIAHQAGILSNSHFREGSSEMIASNLKSNVLMEGKDFRSQVYKMSKDGKKEFDQDAFDQIWPHLCVLARSSPDDKLTLAHGLNQSLLFEDEVQCKRLFKNDNIKIFPYCQVVAMTADGTCSDMSISMVKR